ncbi:MAG TPA: 50S ribosomal protein L25 [Gemmatimonadales bacterium]|jgi:large subunit ribosomal protein L25|nr:50S ribosomal protein L25 [Gemmatimonadales bacterium]
MAQQVSLQAATRNETGKGAARTFRRAGKVPAVIYGHGREPEALIVDAPALSRMLTGISAGSTVVDVTVDGRAPVKALIREIQRNPVRPADIMHVDLYEIHADEKITVEVPVHLTGTADGVRNFGGVLDHILRTLELEVLPGDIPESIDLDVTPLGIGQSLYVRDIKVEKAEILNDEDLPVVTVVAPRAEETAPAAAEEAPSTEPELIRKPKAEDEDAEAKA